MSVDFSTLASGQRQIGIITFQRPQQLNVLNFKMITSILAQLKEWESDDQIAAIIFQSSDNKAFCAGGDVKEVRQMILKSKEQSRFINDIQEFFFNEYLICYMNYTFKKPVVVWAEGITFGAGLGLFRSGHLRVVSENTILAMPEMAIGFFPDVGASWFLHTIPDQIGVYLGLTGLRFYPFEALEWKIATHHIGRQRKPEAIEAIAQIAWAGSLQERQLQIQKVLMKFHTPPKQQGDLLSYKDSMKLIMQAKTLRDFSENLKVHAPLPHMEYIYNASPLSVAVTFEMFRQSKKWTIHEAFMNEWVLATKFSRDSDFAEGVRAVLVDKDKKPNWHFREMLKVPVELIDGFFNFQMLKYDNPWEEYIKNRGSILDM